MIFERFCRDVDEWAKATFPDQTNNRLHRHLQEEVEELGALLYRKDNPILAEDQRLDSDIGDELADILILICATAGFNGIAPVDLAIHAMMKHRNNTESRYAYDPRLGYDKKVKHGPDE